MNTTGKPSGLPAKDDRRPAGDLTKDKAVDGSGSGSEPKEKRLETATAMQALQSIESTNLPSPLSNLEVILSVLVFLSWVSLIAAGVAITSSHYVDNLGAAHETQCLGRAGERTGGRDLPYRAKHRPPVVPGRLPRRSRVPHVSQFDPPTFFMGRPQSNMHHCHYTWILCLPDHSIGLGPVFLGRIWTMGVREIARCRFH